MAKRISVKKSGKKRLKIKKYIEAKPDIEEVPYVLSDFDKVLVANKVMSDTFGRPVNGFRDAEVAILENKFKEL